MEKTILSRANIKFNKRRREREDLIEQRKQEIYDKIPEIRAIEQELTGCSFEALSSVAGGANPEDAVNAFKEKMDRLSKERERLLYKNGFTAEYLNPPYTCKKCSDRGIVDGKLCACYNALVSEELYKESNLGTMLKNQTFDKFDFNMYSDEKIDGTELTAKDNMKEIYDECRSFVNGFDTNHANLIMYGPPGLGKTFLSSCIANSLIEKGVDVFYQSAGQIFTALDGVRFGRGTEADNYLADRIIAAELLIIDDLGTEFINAMSVSELFRIINTRLLAQKSTIISTNLMMNDIKKNYSERVLSRIAGYYSQLRFYGNDIRFE